MRSVAATLSIILALYACPATATVPARQPVPPPAPPGLNFARPHRLAATFGFGFGSASLGRLHDLVDTAVGGAQGPESGLQINAELAFRYYFPYYVLAQVGYGAIYNWASEGAIENYNLAMEVPILVGGYYTFIGRLYAYGALGPSVYFYPRAFFDPGTDFRASPGVGMQVLVGADFMVGENFALGLELRYRYLRTGALMLKDSVAFRAPDGRTYPADTPITEDMLRGNGSSATYDLDFSGISLGLNLRFFAL